ncbi:MAG: M10 family metallopeptidase domain-containing protein [Chitinophagales bacterium]|nr:M10 family metallopeptidase domain-containing protein [Chitinophagales bacterium]MDW8428327.1 hypothetical protein [Chitinophagales bacterium]
MKHFCICLFATLLARQLSAQASFQITYTGFTATQQVAFDLAAQRWAAILQSTVPIKVNALLLPLPSSLLGICFPNGRKDFAAAPFSDTWYPTALANAMSGNELNEGEFDMDIYLNSNQSWNWDTTGSVPPHQYDFVSVAMHELGHGLGFVSLAKVSNGEGSLGLLTPGDFSPLTTSFPWPDLDSLPSIYDRFLVDQDGQYLTELKNPSFALGQKLTSNSLYFAGLQATAANGNSAPRLYAPVTFALGSSITHLNESTYPAGHPDELMTPFVSKGKKVNSIGPVTWAMLADLGWKLNPLQGIQAELTNAGLLIFPTLTHGPLWLHAPYRLNELMLVNVHGQVMLRQPAVRQEEPLMLDLSALPAGCYLLVVRSEDGQWAGRVAKQ